MSKLWTRTSDGSASGVTCICLENNIKTGSKSLSKKKIAALAVAGVVVIVAVSAFSNRRTVIDMNDVYEIIIGGHDGTGNCDCNI